MLFTVLALTVCVWGASISVYAPEYHNISKRAATLLERCAGDTTTGPVYHISLIGLHVDDPKAPPAKECGPPMGSSHFNLHFDQCKDTNCHGCSFPFEDFDQYKALESKYLVPIHNWHAFVHAIGEYKCVCLYDSVTREAHDECFTSDIKDALLSYVKDIQNAAEEVWIELDDLPWYAKSAIIAAVVAACVALFPLVAGAAASAGVVISVEAIADAAAALLAGLVAKFAIPIQPDAAQGPAPGKVLLWRH